MKFHLFEGGVAVASTMEILCVGAVQKKNESILVVVVFT